MDPARGGEEEGTHDRSQDVAEGVAIERDFGRHGVVCASNRRKDEVKEQEGEEREREPRPRAAELDEGKFRAARQVASRSHPERTMLLCWRDLLQAQALQPKSGARRRGMETDFRKRR